MTKGTDERSLAPIAVVAALAVIPGAVLELTKLEPAGVEGGTHFLLVACAALTATVASAILTVAATAAPSCSAPRSPP